MGNIEGTPQPPTLAPLTDISLSEVMRLVEQLLKRYEIISRLLTQHTPYVSFTSFVDAVMDCNTMLAQYLPVGTYFEMCIDLTFASEIAEPPPNQHIVLNWRESDRVQVCARSLQLQYRDHYTHLPKTVITCSLVSADNARRTQLCQHRATVPAHGFGIDITLLSML
jgi:hypothetical protein